MNQWATVLWNGSLSHKFSISNGVRQGGVLSPILFTIYIDDLLVELEKQGVGCFWRHFFVGAVCYADDIALIAPSQSALRLMLRTCSEFASSHSLIFNTSKTQLVEFSYCPSSRCGLADFSFNGEKLRYLKTVKHLGHILSNDLSDNPDIIAVKQSMCRKANHMLTVFGSCDPHTKCKLMQSFCLSLYGSALWAASSSELHSLAVSFNNILRKIWGLPRRCHTAILHCVGGLQGIHNIVITRSNKLISSAQKAGSCLLAEVFTEASTLMYTSFGYNHRYAARHWKSYSEGE